LQKLGLRSDMIHEKNPNDRYDDVEKPSLEAEAERRHVGMSFRRHDARGRPGTIREVAAQAARRPRRTTGPLLNGRKSDAGPCRKAATA